MEDFVITEKELDKDFKKKWNSNVKAVSLTETMEEKLFEERREWEIKLYDLNVYLMGNINIQMDFIQFKLLLMNILKRLGRLFPVELLQIEMFDPNITYDELVENITYHNEYDEFMESVINGIQRIFFRTGFHHFYFKRKGIFKNKYYLLRTEKPKIFK